MELSTGRYGSDFVRVLLFISTAWLSFAGTPSSAAVSKKPVVFVRQAKLSELSETLTYPARIEPRIRASIVAEADGVVTKIIAPLGRAVKAQAPVLVIRNTDPVYQYSPMTVVSPVPGVVSRVEVTEGSRVARGDKLLMVTDPDQVRVVVEIAAQDVSSIRPGMLAELKASKPGGEALQLRVRGISPFVDPATGTASCELEVSKAKDRTQLPPSGVISRVTFRVNKRKGFSIPESAITYRGKDPFVRLIADGKAKLVAVTLGRKEAGMVEIIKGLKSGDQLIERASGFVADGEAVDIQSSGKKDAIEEAALEETSQQG